MEGAEQLPAEPALPVTSFSSRKGKRLTVEKQLSSMPLEALKEALSQHAATLQELQIKSEQLDNALTGGHNLPKIVAAWRNVRQDLTSIVTNFQAQVTSLPLHPRSTLSLVLSSVPTDHPVLLPPPYSCPPPFPSATDLRWNRVSSFFGILL